MYKNETKQACRDLVARYPDVINGWENGTDPFFAAAAKVVQEVAAHDQ